MTFPRVPSFFRLHGTSLFENTKRCVVVSFSGATSVQWSDVEHAPLRLFSSFLPIWVRRRFETCFFYTWFKYSMKDFITRQYLVNVTCNWWFRMCTQFHQKLSYKCMLFVDCLVVLWVYFVNQVRVTKLFFSFSGSNFCPESYVKCHVCHTTVVVMWRKPLNF